MIQETRRRLGMYKSMAEFAASHYARKEVTAAAGAYNKCINATYDALTAEAKRAGCAPDSGNEVHSGLADDGSAVFEEPGRLTLRAKWPYGP
jgi:hypothetical protein